MKFNKKIFIIIMILILIIILLCLMLLVSNVSNKNNKSPVFSVEINKEIDEKIKKEENKLLVEKLSDLSEQKRIEYYATEFIKALEGRKISTAYNMLNKDFKKNYFNTEESFGKYVKAYFPKEVSVKYANMERLENLYVLEVEIKDILTSVNPNHFDCYIVVKENEYADYELSFSVDSAMKNSQDGDEVEDKITEEFEESDIIYESDDEMSEAFEETDVIYESDDETAEESEDTDVIYGVDDEMQEDSEDIEETEE